MTPKNATAVTRSVQFGGEEWEVSDRSLTSASAATSNNLIAFQSASGFVLHRYAHCALNALNDRDLRDLLLLALLSHS
jgi:hypothetical protein